jgi:hypothetical protein
MKLEGTSPTTVWNIIRKHNTHHRPIPPLNGRVNFDGKCSVLRSTLFPEKMAPSLQIPPNFVDSKADLRTELRPVTIREVYNIHVLTLLEDVMGFDIHQLSDYMKYFHKSYRTYSMRCLSTVLIQ